jgi:hypothetical protein
VRFSDHPDIWVKSDANTPFFPGLSFPRRHRGVRGRAADLSSQRRKPERKEAPAACGRGRAVGGRVCKPLQHGAASPGGPDSRGLGPERGGGGRGYRRWAGRWVQGRGLRAGRGGAGRGGRSRAARVSGERGGAQGRGHRRLPIAHNETALSAGSGAEGKHGEGARPGQEEAADRGGGGERSGRLGTASLSDSPLGWVSAGFPGVRRRGRAWHQRYVGSILRRPPRPSFGDPGAPGRGRLSFRAESASSLCVRLCGDRKEGIWVKAPVPASWQPGEPQDPIEVAGHFLLPGPHCGFVARSAGTPPPPGSRRVETEAHHGWGS